MVPYCLELVHTPLKKKKKIVFKAMKASSSLQTKRGSYPNGRTTAPSCASRLAFLVLCVVVPLVAVSSVFMYFETSMVIRQMNESFQTGGANLSEQTSANENAAEDDPKKLETTVDRPPSPPVADPPMTATTVFSPDYHLARAELEQAVLKPHDWQSPQQRLTCEPFLPRWVLDLNPDHERKVFSQYGEDGITEIIWKNLKNVPKTYVEFGVESGKECNTHYFREAHNWTGLMMDGGNDRPEIGLHKEMIHPNNIVSLFEKYSIEKDFGIFSEDTDYADFFIWNNVLEAGYRPRILIGEINGNFFADESATVHDPGSNTRFWRANKYFGLSALALKRLWNKHGYLMIYCTKEEVNCFGVRQEDVLLVDPSPANVKAAQDCVWNKPLVAISPIHKCDHSFEKFHYVDEDGNVDKNREISPRIHQLCREKK